MIRFITNNIFCYNGVIWFSPFQSWCWVYNVVIFWDCYINFRIFLFHFAFVFPLEANKIYNMHLNDIWIKKWKKWWKKKIHNTHSPWNIVLYMFIACIYSYSLYIFITNIAVWATERKKGCFNDTQNTSHFKYIVLWSFLKDLFKLPNLEKKYSIILKLDLSMYLSYYTCIGILRDMEVRIYVFKL